MSEEIKAIDIQLFDAGYEAGYRAGKKDCASPWISIEDRLPEIIKGYSWSKGVLIYIPEIRCQFIASLHKDGFWEYFSPDNNKVRGKVSHWAPPLEPPTKEQ